MEVCEWNAIEGWAFHFRQVEHNDIKDEPIHADKVNESETSESLDSTMTISSDADEVVLTRTALIAGLVIHRFV